jgi:manganese/zinc/iron transport system substrate-binding protein
MKLSRTHILAFVTGLVALMALAGCGPVDSRAAGPAADLSGRKVRTVTTTGMIADIVKNVGGDRVEIEALMGPGVDPHLYKASEGDVLRLGRADAIFYNGLHLEAKMAEVIEKMSDRTMAVAVTDGIDRESLLRPAAFEGQYDPHVWFDVAMWMQATEAVRDALMSLDPGSADQYRANADRYLDELEALQAYVRERAATVPPEQRVVITAHDAFNYFGRAYGFDVRGLQGISTAAEAGAADVRELADFIAERKIRAIFIESSVPVRNVEAVQAAVRARGWDVVIGGELYSDAMGTAGTPDGTYQGMVKHNIDTIVDALLGKRAEEQG